MTARTTDRGSALSREAEAQKATKATKALLERAIAAMNVGRVREQRPKHRSCDGGQLPLRRYKPSRSVAICTFSIPMPRLR